MPDRALSGTRVLEYGHHVSAPYCAKLLAELGAEVVKIEPPPGEEGRRIGPFAADRPHPERSLLFLYFNTGKKGITLNPADRCGKGIFLDLVRRSDILVENYPVGRMREPGQWNDINLGKLGVAIDLTHPSGVELAKRLVKVSDVVAESFRPGVMERLGLGYEALREVKPDIIMASLSGFGQDGPERSFASWAPIFAAMGGLENLTGYADGIPTEQRPPPDLMAGQLLAFAILAALLYRQRTGRGQRIDFAVREGIISALGDAVLEYTLNGREPVRKGNRDNVMAPHDCYRCKGEDRWVSIAVGNDEEWQALCKAIDRPHLAHDPKFADRLNRWRNQDLVRDAIEEWTCGRTPQHAAEQLQAAGVAAFPSMSAADIFSDPHLQARGFLVEMEHPELGTRKAMAPPHGSCRSLRPGSTGLGQSWDSTIITYSIDWWD